MADQNKTLHPYLRDILNIVQNLPEAHKAILEELSLTNELYLEELVRHVGVSDSFYFKVLAKALKAPVKQGLLIALAEIAYTPARREPLWTSAGPTAIKSLVTKWSLTKEESSNLLYNTKITEAVLVSALRAGQFSKDMLREVTEQIGGELKLAGLVAALDTLSDDELSFQMRYASTWIGKRKSSKTSYFSAILHSRPFLAASYLASGSSGQIASLASSPFIAGRDDWAAELMGLEDKQGNPLTLTSYWVHDNRFTLFAMVNSPAVSDAVVARFESELSRVAKDSSNDKEFYEDYTQLLRQLESRKNANRPPQTSSDLATITDKPLYQALVQRAKPSDYRALGRPFDLYTLLKNPLVVKLPRRMTQDLIEAATNELILDEISLLQGSDISALVSNLANSLYDAGLIPLVKKQELLSFHYAAKRAELHESEEFDQPNLTTTEETQSNIDTYTLATQNAEDRRNATPKPAYTYPGRAYHLVVSLPATRQAQELLLALLPEWASDRDEELISMITSLLI